MVTPHITSSADGFRRLPTGRSIDYVLVSTTKYTRKDAAYSAYVRTSIVRKRWCVKFCCCQKIFQSCLGDLNASKYLFYCTVHYNHIKCLIFCSAVAAYFSKNLSVHLSCDNCMASIWPNFSYLIIL